MLTFSKALKGHKVFSTTDEWTPGNSILFTDAVQLSGYSVLDHYELFGNYYEDCGDSSCVVWKHTSVPAELSIQPASIFTGLITLGSEVYGETNYEYPATLRVRTTDGTKWLEIQSFLFNQDTTVTCSNATYNDSATSYPLSYDSETVVECQLLAQVDGTVICRVYTRSYEDNTCFTFSRLQYEYTTGVLFAAGDSLVLELVFNGSVVDEESISKFFGYSLTLSTNVEFTYVDTTFENVLCVAAGTQDNNTMAEGIVCVDFGNSDVVEKQQQVEKYFDKKGTTAVYYNTVSVVVDNYDKHSWALRFKAPLDLHLTHWIQTGYYRTQMLALVNADGSKYIYFYVDYSTDHVRITTHDTVWFTSVATYDYNNEHSFTISIKNFVATFTYYSVYFDTSETAEFNLKEYFGLDTVYAGIVEVAGVFTTYLYRRFCIVSSNISHNPDYGQDANAVLTSVFSGLEASLTTYSKPYICYYKNKLYSADTGDLTALTNMNPSSPSLANKALEVGDRCLVIDEYNRLFLFQVRQGSYATSLPTKVRISDTLYWDLSDHILNTQIRVETYSLTGLVDSAEKLITHTKHNRAHSYAPVVQLRLGSKILTSGITVSVVSETQLRIKTVETTPYEALYINLYIAL